MSHAARTGHYVLRNGIKDLMHDAGLLPQWHAHQDARLWEALEEWVEEHEVELAGPIRQ